MEESKKKKGIKKKISWSGVGRILKYLREWVQPQKKGRKK